MSQANCFNKEEQVTYMKFLVGFSQPFTHTHTVAEMATVFEKSRYEAFNFEKLEEKIEEANSQILEFWEARVEWAKLFEMLYVTQATAYGRFKASRDSSSGIVKNEEKRGVEEKKVVGPEKEEGKSDFVMFQANRFTEEEQKDYMEFLIAFAQPFTHPHTVEEIAEVYKKSRYETCNCENLEEKIINANSQMEKFWEISEMREKLFEMLCVTQTVVDGRFRITRDPSNIMKKDEEERRVEKEMVVDPRNEEGPSNLPESPLEVEENNPKMDNVDQNPEMHPSSSPSSEGNFREDTAQQLIAPIERRVEEEMIVDPRNEEGPSNPSENPLDIEENNRQTDDDDQEVQLSPSSSSEASFGEDTSRQPIVSHLDHVSLSGESDSESNESLNESDITLNFEEAEDYGMRPSMSSEEEIEARGTDSVKFDFKTCYFLANVVGLSEKEKAVLANQQLPSQTVWLAGLLRGLLKSSTTSTNAFKMVLRVLEQSDGDKSGQLEEYAPSVRTTLKTVLEMWNLKALEGLKHSESVELQQLLRIAIKIGENFGVNAIVEKMKAAITNSKNLRISKQEVVVTVQLLYGMIFQTPQNVEGTHWPTHSFDNSAWKRDVSSGKLLAFIFEKVGEAFPGKTFSVLGEKMKEMLISMKPTYGCNTSNCRLGLETYLNLLKRNGNENEKDSVEVSKMIGIYEAFVRYVDRTKTREEATEGKKLWVSINTATLALEVLISMCTPKPKIEIRMNQFLRHVYSVERDAIQDDKYLADEITFWMERMSLGTFNRSYLVQKIQDIRDVVVAEGHARESEERSLVTGASQVAHDSEEQRPSTSEASQSSVDGNLVMRDVVESSPESDMERAILIHLAKLTETLDRQLPVNILARLFEDWRKNSGDKINCDNLEEKCRKVYVGIDVLEKVDILVQIKMLHIANLVPSARFQTRIEAAGGRVKYFEGRIWKFWNKEGELVFEAEEKAERSSMKEVRNIFLHKNAKIITKQMLKSDSIWEANPQQVNRKFIKSPYTVVVNSEKPQEELPRVVDPPINAKSVLLKNAVLKRSSPPISNGPKRSKVHSE